MKYVGTIYFNCDFDTDAHQALVLGSERMTQFADDIEIIDTDVEEVLDDNSMSLSETDGETDASRNV